MNLQKSFSVVFILIIFLMLSTKAEAQFDQKLSKTFGDKNAQSGNDIIEQFVRMQESKKLKTAPKNTSVTKFIPAANSGVAETLAEALGQNAEQKSALTEAFNQIKQAYEAEVAKEGKSNDLAAALTFFISSNVMTYYQTDPPSDQATEELFKELQTVISNVPAFAQMNDSEKQKMHDWLVCMGGFAMANYMDAKQSGNNSALANIKTFADYSLRLVLGVEAEKLKLSANGLTVQVVSSNAASSAQSVNGEIIGTWTRASSSPVGMAGTMDATQKQMVSAGVFRARYVFKSDGTYTFKSEISPQSNVWWTTEETGTFSVSGDTLTVSPKSSKATLRNLDGAVQKTQNNALAAVTYRWKKHYFEGIQEWNLVLEPTTAPTGRDGTIGGNSLFPNAHLYAQGDKLAWRY